MKPQSLQKLINSLNALPGIGKKQAERIAYYLIQNDDLFIEDLQDALKLVQKNIQRCTTCGNISETKECSICTSGDRERKLVIVETSLDVYKFENSQSFKPYYHVLNGLVSVSKKIDADNLNTQNLKERAKNFKEVIIALSPNLEGIVTANYIKQMLGDKVKVTQLAQGIPLGAAMEYVDDITLKAAWDNRKEVK